MEVSALIKIKRILITLFLISLFSLSASFFSKSVTARVTALEPNLNAQSYALVHEDFSNTTFMDGATTAWGWGTGTVTNTRNFSWSQLDYFETEDPVVDLDVQGRKAYASVYNTTFGVDSLTILDLNNPSNISKVEKTVKEHSDLMGVDELKYILEKKRAMDG